MKLNLKWPLNDEALAAVKNSKGGKINSELSSKRERRRRIGGWEERLKIN